MAPTTHAYGALPDQHAELRRPPGAGPHPVAVIVHGGFWRSTYGNETTRPLADALTEAGWTTWNLEYRRVGGSGGYPETLEDVAAACAGLAPLGHGPVVAIGHSAGGHLALWLASRRLVTAAVSLAGVCDLHAAAAERLGRGAAVELMGAAAPGDWEVADPILNVPTGVPTLLVHGSDDDTVPIAQSQAYHRAATAAGDDCTLLELECDHFAVIDPESFVWPQLAAGLEALS